MSSRNKFPEISLTRRELAQVFAAGALSYAVPVFGRQHPSVDELTQAPATSIARAIRSRDVSSAELTQAFLQRIDALNPDINAVVQLNPKAMAEAARADTMLDAGDPVGPLHGVPMTLKDSIDTKGVITTYGTLGRRDTVPSEDATVAARLKAAGAVLLGKTNTPEFTLSFESDNLVYGQTRNPFDTQRSPGGSSGGAAAAVTSAFCAFDIGSDTGGSIRVPSHFCGTAGIKPTAGRVPRTGHAVSFGGIHDGLTQLGPIARSVDDLELILRIIAGPDGRDPFIAPAPLAPSQDVDVAGLQIGWHADNGLFAPTAETQAVTARAAKALAETGAELIEVVPDPLAMSVEEFLALFVWSDDGGAWIRRLLDAAGTEEVHPAIAAQIDSKFLVSEAEMTRKIEVRDQFRSDMLSFMQGYDALLTPVAGFPATLIGETESDANFPGYTYTQIYNLAGLPAAVVRCGTSPEGLPICVQVAAKPWREDIALAVARQLENSFGGWQAPVVPK